MPRYDYKCDVCGDEVEYTHSITKCDNIRICLFCRKGVMKRLISSTQLVEGSLMYPFNLWNIRTNKNGPGYITVNNKTEHKKLLASRGLDSPSFHVGG